ncbi:MAG TPA: tRNA uracil 4-sulfurtransferase ThiI [Victivallales bacterium]|nr:tRNA uracil 4-sulfurtransferase ThiI [Victivallales bacterium]
MTYNEIEYNVVFCRYSEIALKGKNRWRFEQYLITRIAKLINCIDNIVVRKIRGRILIHLKDERAFREEEISKISIALNYVFGLDSYSFSIKIPSDITQILNTVDQTVNNIIFSAGNESNKKLTFRVRVRRSYKEFPLSTKDTEIALADLVLAKYTDLSVNLKKADVTVYCEIHEEYSYIFYTKERGQGGLPSGSNPPVLSLLSGGFDSPVSSYTMMRRGVFVDYISFHSYPFTPEATVDKIKNLAIQLNKFQGERRLFVCNLLEVQKDICAGVYETFRTIHYRRIMFRVAEKIALLNGNKALVTGESVGQVASQTIVNLANIDSAIDMLVLRPLIGADKIDIMNIAEKIGTFELSKEQVPDSCTVFSPSNPSTGAPRKMILNGEKHLDIDELVEKAYKNTVVIDPQTGEETSLDEIFQ